MNCNVTDLFLRAVTLKASVPSHPWENTTWSAGGSTLPSTAMCSQPEDRKGHVVRTSGWYSLLLLPLYLTVLFVKVGHSCSCFSPAVLVAAPALAWVRECSVSTASSHHNGVCVGLD